MTHPNAPLPAEVIAALQRDEVIEAIKLLRQSTGLGLKEAKDRVDAYRSGASLSVSTTEMDDEFPDAPAGNALPLAVMDAAQRGNKIEAIRLYREHTGAGLKEAKDTIEDWLKANPGLSQLSTGEVPRSSGGRLVLLILLIGGIAAWYFWRR